MIRRFYKYFTQSLAVFLPSSFLLAQSVGLKVPSPDSVLSRFDHHGFLKGKVVVEETVVPLAGAAVTLSEQPADSTIDPVSLVVRNRADSAGSYSFCLIPEGQYYLEVDYPGYFSYTESVWIETDGQATVDIQMVPDYSRPHTHETGSVQFELNDRSTGEPIVGGIIRIKELRNFVETDAAGNHYLHLLPPGWYHLSISADGYNDRPDDSVLVAADACTSFITELRELVVSPGDLLCRENHHKPYPVSMIDPPDFGTISGKVIDADLPAPLINAYVYLAPYGRETMTDATGTFTFSGLRPGIYCATVRIPGFRRTTEHEIQLLPGHNVKANVFIRELPSLGDR